MKGKVNEKLLCSEGSVIVEATIVFPIMFFIVFLLIFLGNAYYQRSQIEATITETAFKGAAYCVDPILETITERGSIPRLRDLEVEPYRYIFGGMNDIERKIKDELDAELGEKTESIFDVMKPNIKGCEVHYNSMVVYATFSVQVEYEIVFPIKMFWSDFIPIYKVKARAEVPVSDTPDFIRNVDMVVDYIKEFDFVGKVADKFTKIKNFLSEFGE